MVSDWKMASEATPWEDTQDEADRCIICGARQVEGIRICMQLICERCEQEMIHTDANDERYVYYLHRLRKIFHHLSHLGDG